jgi:hypothetical protein
MDGVPMLSTSPFGRGVVKEDEHGSQQGTSEALGHEFEYSRDLLARHVELLHDLVETQDPSGHRSRTRNSIGAVRHVFLDADHDGAAVLSRVEARQELPSPSYILHSSPNHIHVFWCVSGFDPNTVERLQKQLARELQTDPAATPVTQTTRLAAKWQSSLCQNCVT